MFSLVRYGSHGETRVGFGSGEQMSRDHRRPERRGADINHENITFGRRKLTCWSSRAVSGRISSWSVGHCSCLLKLRRRRQRSDRISSRCLQRRLRASCSLQSRVWQPNRNRHAWHKGSSGCVWRGIFLPCESGDIDAERRRQETAVAGGGVLPALRGWLS